ncbi:MAG: GNAT family N-acetyltransferase [Candidatus Muiribacteriota bacterium]
MKTKLKIKQVNINDKESLKEILKIEKEAFGKGALHSWVLAPFVISQEVFILTEKDKTVGCAILLNDFSKETFFFFSFALLKKYRGKGLGKYFFGRVINKIFQKYNELNYLKLTVDPEKQVNLKLFKKVGFEEKKFLEDFYSENENRILMEISRKRFYEGNTF